MGSSIDITWWQLAVFMSVLIIPFAINVKLKLHLGREIFVSIVRMICQLILVGLYLEFLFSLDSLWINIIWLSIMILIGASAIVTSAKLPRRVLYFPVLVGLIIGVVPMMLILLLLLLKPQPVYNAQYLIPLAGMLLGNSLSGNIVALQRLFTAFDEKKMEYEGVLALGGQPYQAAFPFLQSALSQSLAPILASMTSMGLVTLPGMMTGQILGGSDPMLAVKYQLIILVAIFVTLSVSVTSSLILSINRSITHTGLVTIGIGKK
ncbi:ABC transporter permease [Shewanella sp. D64]|uniref:ABC transporter permease n=1 Tax=unclassified Shewanella TaxID=196818 RepID=UPI0022BA5E32|nr:MULTISPECIES: ABC transporter permease [unclassified Shewanella]MEC4728072.1 ABC transporter permease [Shewanella sp. D64]MEC4738170.1 ABC transporter permease [Shewanella sp. E94]WBJ98084.1 ABC transporter permease [Shewanella sp. MTB7]